MFFVLRSLKSFYTTLFQRELDIRFLYFSRFLFIWVALC